MGEGQNILLTSLIIFVVFCLAFLGFTFFIYPNLDSPQQDLAVLPESDDPDVLSVFEQTNPYAYECPGTFPVVEVPNDFPTIQSAIDAATAGTVISVFPGIYSENIVLKPEICLIAQEFAKSEIQGLGDVVIEATSKNKIKNFKITSLGRSDVGISLEDAQEVNIEINSFENLNFAISASEESQLSAISNSFRNVGLAFYIQDSDFFVEQSNIRATNSAMDIVFSKGDIIGMVFEGGEYGVKAKNSELFFDKNIFKKQSVAALELSQEGDYEFGNNFFDGVNEEILYSE